VTSMVTASDDEAKDDLPPVEELVKRLPPEVLATLDELFRRVDKGEADPAGRVEDRPGLSGAHRRRRRRKTNRLPSGSRFEKDGERARSLNPCFDQTS